MGDQPSRQPPHNLRHAPLLEPPTARASAAFHPRPILATSAGLAYAPVSQNQSVVEPLTIFLSRRSNFKLLKNTAVTAP